MLFVVVWVCVVCLLSCVSDFVLRVDSCLWFVVRCFSLLDRCVLMVVYSLFCVVCLLLFVGV